MTDREAIKMALEWMEATHHTAMTTYSDEGYEEHCKVEIELRQALAQPEIQMSPEHLPQYIATNNIKPTTEGGGGAGGAQPEQEPVAYIDHVSGKPKFIDGYVVQTDYDIPLYTAPPKREWVGLHLDDIPEIHVGNKPFLHGARWAEVKLKEKNT